jgi:hypothetical protein
VSPAKYRTRQPTLGFLTNLTVTRKLFLMVPLSFSD